jgi:hypothetical protein
VRQGFALLGEQERDVAGLDLGFEQLQPQAAPISLEAGMPAKASERPCSAMSRH